MASGAARGLEHAGDGPYRCVGAGVRLSVKLVPKARRSGFDGIERDADGTRVVKARVTAAPEGGKANRALLVLLGRAIGMAPSRLEIAIGAQARRKVVHINGNGREISARLDAWLGEMG